MQELFKKTEIGNAEVAECSFREFLCSLCDSAFQTFENHEVREAF